MEIKQYIITFLSEFLKILGEMAPFLLLGFFFAGLLYAFIPKTKIEKYFNGQPFKSSALAAMFGIPLPLCSCGVIPTGMAFYKSGASKGGTVSFLISTPQTGIDSILATFSLMGLPFALVRPFAALITGITGGLITSVVTKDDHESHHLGNEAKQNNTLNQKLVSVFKYGFVEFIQDISKWLVIGLVLAAVISAIIPDNFFDLLNLPPIVQMLIILAVSVPLYICATGSIPLAAILIMKGVSPGAALVLLMAGPATNAATITMIGKVLGRKTLLAYLITIIVGALGFGLIIDYVLPAQWFTLSNIPMVHQHGGHLVWWQIMSAITMLVLIVNGYLQKHLANKKEHAITNLNISNMATQTIKVDGMTCNHCKANVERGLEQLSFVNSVKVNLADKTVTLEGDHLELETIKNTINDLGYKVI